MYTIADLQMSVAQARLDELRRSAALHRQLLSRKRRRRAATVGPSSSSATRVGPPTPTFEHVLEQVGWISGHHRFADAGDDHVALRRVVAELVSVAARAGVCGVPVPRRRDPAVVLHRIAGVLAARTVGRHVPTDEPDRRRLERRLDALRRATTPPGFGAERADGGLDGVVDVSTWHHPAARRSHRSVAA